MVFARFVVNLIVAFGIAVLITAVLLTVLQACGVVVQDLHILGAPVTLGVAQ